MTINHKYMFEAWFETVKSNITAVQRNMLNLENTCSRIRMLIHQIETQCIESKRNKNSFLDQEVPVGRQNVTINNCLLVRMKLVGTDKMLDDLRQKIQTLKAELVKVLSELETHKIILQGFLAEQNKLEKHKEFLFHEWKKQKTKQEIGIEDENSLMIHLTIRDRLI